jgi:5'-deoxynucleotidase YfbR-like HD superfamily hydrolase
MKPLIEAQLYRDAGAVKRYHVKRTLRQQTVAEHTFGMLMLVKQVAPHIDKSVLYAAILHHDLPELMTGDVPAPIKRAHPELGPLMNSIEEELAPLYDPLCERLTQEEASLLKWADRMELVLWCLEEYRMGNTFVLDTIRRGIGWILAAAMPDCCRELTEAVVRELRDKHHITPAVGTELERNA